MAARAAMKFGGNLKELRIHLCQKSASSQGVRDFIETSYVPMKKSNPRFPILIRECSGIEPKVYARYEFGKENSSILSGMTKDQVLQQIEQLTNKTS
ncbi:NADH dehydrogenase [ubiquinone] 1 alpha subcomplex subunit 2-like [Tubulanus polymorphus]|uniref:NADH dehydrogenase [ubiquinone] 1 alpha subcomplex subunit 2-like n=1 Tax=Tubulanus polymorphus TaxID=672921 RepID=UPI003DA39022